MAYQKHGQDGPQEHPVPQGSVERESQAKRQLTWQTLADRATYERLGMDPAAVQAVWASFLGGDGAVTWSRVWALVTLGQWAGRHRVAA